MGHVRPATGWRKIWGARGARRPALSESSPRFGPIEGLESEIVGQTFGPRRVPSQGAPWPLIAAAGAVLVLAALTARWGWVRAQSPQDLSPAPAQAQSANLAQGATPSGEATLAVAQRALEDPPRSGAAERQDDKASAEPPVPAALPERVPGMAVRAASTPVPTLFLDEVAQASDDLSHEPVTLELFKATLPQRSADTDPLRHAAGAVTESSENR
jgi:hypothetical protein